MSDPTMLAIEDTYNEIGIAIKYMISGVDQQIYFDNLRYKQGLIDGLNMAYGIIEQMKEYMQ